MTVPHLIHFCPQFWNREYDKTKLFENKVSFLIIMPTINNILAMYHRMSQASYYTGYGGVVHGVTDVAGILESFLLLL